MKSLTIVAFLAALAFATASHEFCIWNNCPFTIWPALQTNRNGVVLENGDFLLNSYNTKAFRVPNGWAGRVWARTNCDGTEHCETSDCGRKIQCRGTSGVPPVSLAEFTLSSANGGKDLYHVSLVNGYNLPVEIFPIAGTYKRKSGGHFDCPAVGCHRVQDMVSHCPRELSMHNSSGSTIGCMSACQAFSTDQYCCRNAYNTADKGKASRWPVNYAAMFKHVCPDASSYAFDDNKSTFTCHGQPKAGYVIKFCP